MSVFTEADWKIDLLLLGVLLIAATMLLIARLITWREFWRFVTLYEIAMIVLSLLLHDGFLWDNLIEALLGALLWWRGNDDDDVKRKRRRLAGSMKVKLRSFAVIRLRPVERPAEH
jgi:hypothetical protein